jgi:predicted hotdog family 3-hydroxylacyl-ACP dehydratase
MFLLSRIIDYDLDKRTLKAEYDITGDCLFYDGELNGVPSWVGFEFMAQCVSAITGLDHRRRGEAPKMGFILSVSALEIQQPVLKAGSTVSIAIAEDVHLGSVFTFDCGVSSGEGPAARAKLSVYEAEDPAHIEKGNHGN